MSFEFDNKTEDEKKREMQRIIDEISKCEKCELHKTRKKPVPGEGSINSRIMLIGEAPGRNEDEQGRPFVGQAGKFLNQLLKEAGIRREEVYITNIIKCRPQNNRDPTEKEIKSCSPYLDKQLNIIKPKAIITLGNYATKYILRKFKLKEESISKIHGKKYKINNLIFNTKIMPSYHPAAALYNPNLKQTIIDDFKKIREELK